MMENRYYLLTGAAGFLGSNICAQLLAEGKKVRALVLPNDKSVKFIPKELEVVIGDLCDEASLEPFFTVPEGCTSVIIHCASMVTVDPGYSEKLMAVNVGGTRNIITKVLAHPECEKMVYVSSTGAIPEQVEVVLGDLTDAASLEAFFTVPEGCTSVVIHCASMVTVNPNYSETDGCQCWRHTEHHHQGLKPSRVREDGLCFLHRCHC